MAFSLRDLLRSARLGPTGVWLFMVAACWLALGGSLAAVPLPVQGGVPGESEAGASPSAAPSLGTSPVAAPLDAQCVGGSGIVPRVHVILVEPGLEVAVLRHPDGGLRMVGPGDPVEPTAETPCLVERFYRGALQCVEGDLGARRLRVAETSGGRPSRVEVLARCAPDVLYRPSTTSTKQDLPPP